MVRLGDSYRMRIVISKSVDLDEAIRDCLNFLDSLSLDSEIEERIEKARTWVGDLADPLAADDIQKRYKQILLQGLFDVLNDITPEGCYFGGHPVDQTLIGFWEKSVLKNEGE